jgi:polyketide biosynthesis acyl carrier protein
MTVSRSADDWSARAETQRILYEVITEILPDLRLDEIDPGQHLTDLGADSVDRVEILYTAVERLGVSEPASAFSATRNIGTLLERLTTASRR